MIEPVPDVRTVLASDTKKILSVLSLEATVHVPSTVPVEATVIFVPTGYAAVKPVPVRRTVVEPAVRSMSVMLPAALVAAVAVVGVRPESYIASVARAVVRPRTLGTCT
jgi:hypothetical protein